MDSTTTHFALPEKSSLGLRDQIGEIVQEVVALFFQPGHYDSHLRNIERRYKRRASHERRDRQTPGHARSDADPR